MRNVRGEWLEDWVDLLWFWNSEIGFTLSGGLLRVVAIEQPDLETASEDELLGFYRDLTSVLTMPGTGWTAWIDQWRRTDREYLPETDFGGNVAAQIVDASRRAQFQDNPRGVFTNRLYLSLHWVPQDRDIVLAILTDRDSTSISEARRAFIDQTDEIFRALKVLCPDVRLQCERALGTYLDETVNYERVERDLPEAFSGASLVVSEWDNPGAELIVDGLHVVSIEVHAFGAVTPLTLEFLHELPFECRWTTTIHFLDPDHQRSALERLRKSWGLKQHSGFGWVVAAISRDRSHAPSRADVEGVLHELHDLQADLPATRDGLAIATMTVRVWDRDPAVAEDRADTVRAFLNGAGLRSRIATSNAVLGPIADIPGNASRDLVNRRKPRIPISTISRCAPMTGLTSGQREDQHLGGPALMVAQSRRMVPLFWSLHPPGSDVGHTAVIGPTGGGKSVFLVFMAMQYMRYPGSTVTIFDKRRSAMVATLCSDDSRWIELGSGGAGVQPLREIDDPGGMAWAATWLQEALRLRQVPATADVDAALAEALSAVRTLPKDERTLSALCAFLGGHDGAQKALRHYTQSGGPLGALMDGSISSYGDARLLCIEIDPVMHLAEAPLVLAACFRQLERERLSGEHPKLVMADEVWQPLQHPLFRGQIEDLARTMRKLNGQLVLCTQSIRDLDGEQTAVIMEQVAQTVFTANPQADNEGSSALYRKIGLTEKQIGSIAGLRPKGEYLLKTPMFCRVADFTLEGDALRICGASRPTDIQRARSLLADGVNPGKEFRERWLAK